MYKNPQLSTQAKRLRTELTKYSLAVTHAQALEVVAAMAGSRSLHVEHAKNNAGVAIADVARKQAADLMFETLGRFDGNVTGLLASIRAAFEVEALGGSRSVEHAVHELFETGDAPKVSALFDDARLENLPAAFDAIVTRLTATLEQSAQATAKAAGTALNQALLDALTDFTESVGTVWNTESSAGTRIFEKAVAAIAHAKGKAVTPVALNEGSGDSVYECEAFDWRLSEGHEPADLPAHHTHGYTLQVKRNKSHQLFVDLAPSGKTLDQLSEDGLPQMSLFIEINEGRPCVHMTNTLFGDNLLTVFFTEDGLLLRPDGSTCAIRTGTPSGALLQLQNELNTPYLRSNMDMAFIPASNAG